MVSVLPAGLSAPTIEYCMNLVSILGKQFAPQKLNSSKLCVHVKLDHQQSMTQCHGYALEIGYT